MAAVTESDKWAGRALRARREKRGFKQDELAELAGIDRGRYNALENGRQRISPTYAERLAPHLGIKDPRRLLPPKDQQQQVRDDPLSRLEALEGEVARLREERERVLQEVVARLAALEANQVQQAQRSVLRSTKKK